MKGALDLTKPEIRHEFILFIYEVTLKIERQEDDHKMKKNNYFLINLLELE